MNILKLDVLSEVSGSGVKNIIKSALKHITPSCVAEKNNTGNNYLEETKDHVEYYAHPDPNIKLPSEIYRSRKSKLNKISLQTTIKID